MRRIVAAGCCLFAFATASCAAILGFDRLEEGPGGLPEAGPDAPVDEADAADPCLATGYPDNPGTVDDGVNIEVIGALRRLDFGIGADAGSSFPSYNLDRTCTTSPATSTCTVDLSSGTTNFDTSVRDKADGGDNAGFGLIQLLADVPDTSLTQENINQGVVDGRYGAVIRVSLWNGTPDDPRVLVQLAPANGFVRSSDGGTRPSFDEDDLWQLDRRYEISNTGGPTQSSTLAYVAGGVLVARFDRLDIQMRVSDDPRPFDIKLREVVLTGGITTDGGFLTGGIIAGRWPTTTFLEEARQIYIRDGNGYENVTICKDNPGNFYGLVKIAACNARDIRGDGQDRQNLGCDAISTAARIEGYRVKRLGNFVDGGDFSGRCAGALAVSADDCVPPP